MAVSFEAQQTGSRSGETLILHPNPLMHAYYIGVPSNIPDCYCERSLNVSCNSQLPLTCCMNMASFNIQ